ncbi:MAG: class A beta-lactamase-related serine hydrolase [Armatimonadota bacterium]|nr:class A beta-lactamase-related serine hydrolase [Armatimonadota bacterium]
MASLESAIREILERNSGVFGIAAWNSADGAEFLHNEHEVFPSASVIKVPIIVEIFWQRDEGRLSLDEKIILRDKDKVQGSGILKELHEGLELTLGDLAVLMIVLSDNTATNILIDRIGADAVTSRMRSLGLEKTTLARKMYDWEQARLGKENLCTPYEMMLLLRGIACGKIPSINASQEIIEIMARQQYRDKIPLMLPDDLKVANKTGSISGVTHDVAVVYAPWGPYVLCVMTKGIDDREDQRIAKLAIAEVSRVVYDHFSA